MQEFSNFKQSSATQEEYFNYKDISSPIQSAKKQVSYVVENLPTQPSIEELNLNQLNQVLSSPNDIKKNFGNVLPYSEAFKGVFNEIWNDNSLTGSLVNNTLEKLSSLSIADGEGLTEEQFKNSKYYLEDMRYPNFPINELIQKKWNEEITSRKNAQAISTLSSPTQKVIRMGASFLAGIPADPIMSLTGGLTGGLSKSLAKASFFAGMENLIADAVVYQMNKERFYLQGYEKTDEERRYEMLGAFGFGAGIGAIGYGFGKYFANKFNKEIQAIDEIQTQNLTEENYLADNPIKETQVITTEKPKFKTKAQRDLELLQAKESIKTQEQLKRFQGKADIKYNYQEKIYNLKQQKTPEQQVDKMTKLFQARQQLEATTRMNAGDIYNIENNVDNLYRTTNQASKDTFLPETLEVQGLSIPEINVKYKVVDLKSLIYSNRPDGSINESFPKKYQPRDRAKDYIGLLNIQKIANNLSPNQLIYNAGGITSGSPLITQDGVVIAGNGRSMALEMAFDNNKASNYTDTLKNNFSQFDYQNLDRPVLVREIVSNLTDDDLIKLSRNSNISEVDSYTALENIKNDAKILEENDIALLYNGGSFDSKDNASFYNAFFSRLPQETLKNYIDGNGNLTIQGTEKLKSAIMYSAYGDDLLISNVFVNLEDEVSKSLVNALNDVAPKIIKAKTRIKQQDVDAELDIATNFAEAFNYYYSLDNVFLRDNINNPNIFGEPFLNPITETILRGFYRDEARIDKLLSKADLQTFLNNYWDKVLNSKSTPLLNQKLFNPKILLEEAKKGKDIYIVADKEVNYSVVNDDGGKIAKESFIYTPENYPQLQAREIERTFTKEGYKVQGGATKSKITREEAKKILETGQGFTETEIKDFYKAEGDILNLSLFNKTAKQFREQYPEIAKTNQNMRDYASINELTILNELQAMNTKFINENLDETIRFENLYNYSVSRLDELNKSNPLGRQGINPTSIEKEMLAVEQNMYNANFKAEAIDVIKNKVKRIKQVNDYIACRLTK